MIKYIKYSIKYHGSGYHNGYLIFSLRHMSHWKAQRFDRRRGDPGVPTVGQHEGSPATDRRIRPGQDCSECSECSEDLWSFRIAPDRPVEYILPIWSSIWSSICSYLFQWISPEVNIASMSNMSSCKAARSPEVLATSSFPSDSFMVATTPGTAWRWWSLIHRHPTTSNDIQRHLVLANGYTIATPLKCRPSSAFCFLYIISDDVVLGCFCNTALQIFEFPPLAKCEKQKLLKSVGQWCF